MGGTPARSRACAALVVGLGSAFVAAGCGGGHPLSSPPPPVVSVAPVVQRDVPVHTDYVGTLDAYVNADARARVQGILLEQHFTEGSTVKAGQLLFVIDPKPFEAARLEAEGALAQAKAALAKAEADVARDTPLVAKQAVSQQDLDNAIAARASAIGQVATAQGQLETARLNLGYTRVTSPVDGIAGIAQVRIGNLVGQGEPTLLASVSDVDPIRVVLSLPEREYIGLAERIAEFERIQAQGGHGPDEPVLQLILADGSVYRHTGRFAIVGAQVNPATGTLTLYGGGATVSWEPDVFGGLRRTAEEARANFFASEEARRGVWLTVLADVAQAYFQLVSLDVQREITLRTIDARKETLELYRTQLQGGVGTGLQVARAEADVYGAQSTLADLERQIAISEDSISLLLGGPPAPIARPAAASALPPPPEVPVGLPSTLLERRPDIRQAEQQLVAANAEVGVRTAALYPTFSLTGAAGLSSATLLSLASEQGWAYLLFGTADWTAPLLKGAALRDQLAAAKAAKDAARIAYEQAMLTAIREVADALASLGKMREERARQEQQVASLRGAVDIAQSQFHGGTVTYLDVVSAQENSFAAELALAQLEGQQLSEFTQLYRALGGGWWLVEKSEAPSTQQPG